MAGTFDFRYFTSYLQLTRIPASLLCEHHPRRRSEQILTLERLAERPDMRRFAVLGQGRLILVRLQHHEDRGVAFGLALKVVPQDAGLVGFHGCGGGGEKFFYLVG